MTNSYSSFTVTPQITRPLKFMHYSGPKSTDKSTPSSHAEENCGANLPSSESLVTSAPVLANTDTAKPPLELQVLMDLCEPEEGSLTNFLDRQQAPVKVIQEEKVQGVRESPSVAKPTSPKINSPQASSETGDSALDDSIMDPHESREPTPSHISGKRKCSVFSQTESDMDMSDCGSRQPALYQRHGKRSGQSPQLDESEFTCKPIPESNRGNSMCVAGTAEAQTDHVRSDDSFLSQEPTPYSYLERTPPLRERDECESAHTLRDTISRYGRVDSSQHTRPHQRNPIPRLEPYQKRSSRTMPRQRGHTSTCNPPPIKAEAWSRRFARKPSTSRDSMISRARDIPSVQPHLAGLHVGQAGPQEITVQPISSELSYFVAVLPSFAGVQALLQADPRLSGGLEKVIVKQLQPTMWLLTGTLRSSYNRSLVGAPPDADYDDSSDRGSQSMSSDETMSEDESGDESGEQFSAKNQRWSSEDDDLLCGWVEAGKPWRWIISRFPMRTPGSVRTRYSVLRRKSSRARSITR